MCCSHYPHQICFSDLQGGKKSKKSKKEVPPDPEKLKKEKLANDATQRKRNSATAAIQWVAVARQWVQQERSRLFDQFRITDVKGSGLLDVTESMTAILALKPPLAKSEVDALIACIERNGKVDYMQPPDKLRSYGGMRYFPPSSSIPSFKVPFPRPRYSNPRPRCSNPSMTLNI